MGERMKAEKREHERAAERAGAHTEPSDAAESSTERDGGEPDGEAVGDGASATAAESEVSGEPPRGAEPAAEADETMEGASEAELAGLQAELESLNERHLRLAAEFDNYRKRIGREREELRTRAQADLVKHLLEVLDDLQRVAEYEAEPDSAEALLEGVQLVEKKFRHALATAGLEPIQAEGEFFNPNTMEALMTLPAEHPEEDDVVADVFQKGYRFGELLIRPARVRVKKYEQSE